jgi:hypothetical protein
MTAEDGADDAQTGRGDLMAQTVLSRVTDRIQAEDKERSERVSIGLLLVLIGIPIIAFFEHRGSSGRGYVAALFVGVFVVIAWAERNLIRQRWCWLSLGCLAALHLFIWILVPVHWQESRASIYFIGYGDFFVSAFVMQMLGRKFGNAGGQSSSPA